jgi:uncharacterized protein (DUF2147 family)
MIYIRTILLVLITSTLTSFYFSSSGEDSKLDAVKVIELDNGTNILGHWTTLNTDLTVKVSVQNGKYEARIIDFRCTCPVKTSINSHKDVHNPNPDMCQNSWIGSKVLWNLKYEGNNKWIDGTIYNLNTGSEYSSFVKLMGSKLEVRGYYGFEFLGQSLIFVRP